jgi:hypothetical protein
LADSLGEGGAKVGGEGCEAAGVEGDLDAVGADGGAGDQQADETGLFGGEEFIPKRIKPAPRYRYRVPAPDLRPLGPVGHRGGRLRRRAGWHWGGGAGYCGGCRSSGRDCGGACPYVSSQLQTIEGWQAWDVATRALMVTVLGRAVVPAIDRTLALTQAESLGYDVRVVVLLLPAIEAGLWEAVGKIATPGDEACDQAA